MAPSSSGGTTVGEALNILERYDLAAMSDATRCTTTSRPSALAFADRARTSATRRTSTCRVRDLLSDEFAAERACQIDPTQALAKPVAAGDVTSYDGECDGSRAATSAVGRTPRTSSTTNLTVADRWGNVVEYTLTIEQTGGSASSCPAAASCSTTS